MDYSTLNQTIVEYTENNELTFVTAIPKMIQLAEKRIYIEAKLPQFRTHETWRLTSGTASQALPDNFLAPNSLLVDDAMGNMTYLDLKEPEYAMAAFGVNVIGVPRVYAMHEDKEFVVGPIPDSAYEVTMDYFYYPESITTVASGHTWLGDNFDMLLLYASLCEAYIFMKGEADIMQAYQLQYATALSLLKDFAKGSLKHDTYRAVA